MRRVIKAEAMRGPGANAPMPLDLTDVGAEARRALADARAKAQQLVAEAQDEAVAVLREAQQRGYQEGLTRGRAEGLAAGRSDAEQQAGASLASDTAELTSLARKVVDELAAGRANLLEQGRAELLNLAIEIAEKIVAQVAEADIEAAAANLAKVLELADGAADIVVKVNPDQLQQLQRRLPDLLELLRVGGRVSLLGDARISRGGARLLGRHGEIDATIETQLANVVEALLGPKAAAASHADQIAAPQCEPSCDERI
ncbi:MAG TPA: FliH/SctL family protein [Phycisphaerae bacterium]|nr:FliH/SctL family protein [Phycisphaerae bacterium]